MYTYQINKASMNNKVINYNEFDFSKSAVIKPISNGDDHDNKRYTRVVVDSRDRNLKYYPTPSQYEIGLPEDIEDVVGAELQVVDIPFTSYLIDKHNNKLSFIYDSVTYHVTISKGDYTPESLANKIQEDVLNQTSVALTVTYVAHRDSYDFSMDKPFSFLFNGPDERYTMTSNEGQTTLTYDKTSIAKVIGFGPYTYTSVVRGSLHVLESEFKKNFNEHKYIVMHVEQISLNSSSNPVLHKSFALIPQKINDLNVYQTFQLKKTLNPPIPKLGRLKISFRNYLGEPYDFQNHDHRFDIIFESYKHTRRYHSYITN